MIIEIPQKLNGHSFYSHILPKIYKQILDGDYRIDFSLCKTQLANPEGFVNLFASALMIKNKYNYLPILHMPESENLISFMESINFFQIANVPFCETFRINHISNYNRKLINISQIYGIYVHSEFSKHYNNIKDIVNSIQIEIDSSNQNSYEVCYFYNKLKSSLIQLIRNTIEHNSTQKEYGALGYYMAQKTPYNTIDFVFSDIGQGYRNRIIEMIKENTDKNISKYLFVKDKLLDNSFLFRESNSNPNRIAILAAVDFRSDSEIPGLYQIKKFATSKGGYLFIHSGNYSIKFEANNKNTFNYYPNYFSGCHIKMEIPIPQENCHE